MVITVVPFLFDSYYWLALVPAFLGLFEGVVHVVCIKILRIGKPYSPGMITAECELITAVVMFWYFSSHHLVVGWHYLIAAVVMFLCFVIMQKTLLRMVGFRYRDLPKIIKESRMNG